MYTYIYMWNIMQSKWILLGIIIIYDQTLQHSCVNNVLVEIKMLTIVRKNI